MPNEPRDDLDRELLEPVLDELYRKELSELGGDSCRNRFAEMIEDRWKKLTLHSCNRRKESKPANEDALLALDSLKHSFFEKEPQLLNFTLPELWRLLKGLTLRSWLSIVPLVISVLGFAFWLGRQFAK